MRRVIRRIAASVAAAALAISLASCTEIKRDAPSENETAPTFCVALIRDCIGGLRAYDEVSSSLSGVCEEYGYEYAEFSVFGDVDVYRTEAIDSAVSYGADAVVCLGSSMRDTVLSMQYLYTGCMFLLIDVGEPSDEIGEVLSSNTHFAVLCEEDAGYVAGVIAATECREPYGFLAFYPGTSAARTFGGFVAGLNETLEDKSRSAEVICSCNNGTAIITDDDGTEHRKSELSAAALFDEGCGVVASYATESDTALEAALAAGGKVIPIANDTARRRGTTLSSPVFNYGAAARSSIVKLAASGGKWGVRESGTYTVYGPAEGAIEIDFADGAFDGDALAELKDAALRGKIKIPHCDTFDEIVSYGVSIIYAD